VKKLALGCSLSTLLIVLGVLTAALWGGSCYVTLTGEEVRVESAWTRLENACLHRIDLAGELLAIGRQVSAIPRDDLDRLADALDRSSELVASPEVLARPEAAETFEDAQDQLVSAVGALLEGHGAQLDQRAPEAMRRLRAQYAQVDERVAEAEGQLDQAVEQYNRAVTGFPHRAVATLLGFDNRVFAPPHAR